MEDSDIDFQALFGINFTPQEAPTEPELDGEKIAIFKKKIILTDELINKFSETLKNFNRLKKENIKNLEDLKKCRQALATHLKANKPWEKKYNDLQSKFSLIEQELLFKDNLVAARDSSLRQYSSLVKDQEVEISQLKVENKILKTCDDSKSEEKWRRKYFNVLKRFRNLKLLIDKSQCSNCSTLKEVGHPLSEENSPLELDLSIGIPASVSSIDTGFESPNISDCESETDLNISGKKWKKQTNSSARETLSASNSHENAPPTVEIPSKISFVNDNVEVVVLVDKPNDNNDRTDTEEAVSGGGCNICCRHPVPSHNKYVQTFVRTYADACVDVKSDVLNKHVQTDTIVQQKTSTLSRGTDPIEELVETSGDISVGKNLKLEKSCQTEKDLTVVSSFEKLPVSIFKVNDNQDLNVTSSVVKSCERQYTKVNEPELEDILCKWTLSPLPMLLSPLPASPCATPRASTPECESNMGDEALTDSEMNMDPSLDNDSSEDNNDSSETIPTYVDAIAQTDLSGCLCQHKKGLVDIAVQVNVSEVKSEFHNPPTPFYNKYAARHSNKHKKMLASKNTQRETNGEHFWKEIATLLLKKSSEYGYSLMNRDEMPVLYNNFVKLKGESLEEDTEKEDILYSLSNECMTVKPITVIMNRKEEVITPHPFNLKFSAKKGNLRTTCQNVETVTNVGNKEGNLLSMRSNDEIPKHNLKKRKRSVRKKPSKKMKILPNAGTQFSHSGMFTVSSVAKKTLDIVERVTDDLYRNEVSATSSHASVDTSDKMRLQRFRLNEATSSHLENNRHAVIEKTHSKEIHPLNSGCIPLNMDKNDDISVDRVERLEEKSFRNERVSESVPAPLNELRINHSLSIDICTTNNNETVGEDDFLARKSPDFDMADTPSSILDANIQTSTSSSAKLHSHSVALNISQNETSLTNEVSKCLVETSALVSFGDVGLQGERDVLADSSEEWCSAGDVHSEDAFDVESGKSSPNVPNICSQENVELHLPLLCPETVKNNSDCTVTSQLKSSKEAKFCDNLGVVGHKTSNKSCKEPCGLSLGNSEADVTKAKENIFKSDECSRMKILKANEKLPGNLSKSSVKRQSGFQFMNKTATNKSKSESFQKTANSDKNNDITERNEMCKDTNITNLTSPLSRNVCNSLLPEGNATHSAFSSESDSDEETTVNTNERRKNLDDLTNLSIEKNKISEVLPISHGNTSEGFQNQKVLKEQSSEKDGSDVLCKLSNISKVNVGVVHGGKQSQLGVFQEFSEEQSISAPVCQESYSCVQMVSNASSGYSSEVSAHSFTSSSSLISDTVLSASFSINKMDLQRDDVQTQNSHSSLKVVGNQEGRSCNMKGNDSGFMELGNLKITENVSMSNGDSTIHLRDGKEMSENNDCSFTKVSFRQLCKSSINEKIPVVAPSEVDAATLKRKIIDQVRIFTTNPQKKAKTGEATSKSNLKLQLKQPTLNGDRRGMIASPCSRLGMSGRRRTVCGTQPVHQTSSSQDDGNVDNSQSPSNYLEISRKQQRVAHTPRHKNNDEVRVPAALQSDQETFVPNIACALGTERVPKSYSSEDVVDSVSSSRLSHTVSREKKIMTLKSTEKEYSVSKYDSSTFSLTSIDSNLHFELSSGASSLKVKSVSSMGTSSIQGTCNKLETSNIFDTLNTTSSSKCSAYIFNQVKSSRQSTRKEKAVLLTENSQCPAKLGSNSVGRNCRTRLTGKKSALQKFKNQCVKLRKNSQIESEVNENLCDVGVLKNTARTNTQSEANKINASEVSEIEDDMALSNSNGSSNDGNKLTSIQSQPEITSPKSKKQKSVLVTKCQELFPDSTWNSFQALSEDLTLSDSDESSNEINNNPKKYGSSPPELQNFGETISSIHSDNEAAGVRKGESNNTAEHTVQSTLEISETGKKHLNIDLSIDSFESATNTQKHNFFLSSRQLIHTDTLHMTVINSQQSLMSEECPSLNSHNEVTETSNIKVVNNMNEQNKDSSSRDLCMELNLSVRNKRAQEVLDEGPSENQPDILEGNQNSLRIDSPASPPDVQDRSSNTYSCVFIPCSPVHTIGDGTPNRHDFVGGNGSPGSCDTGVSNSFSDEDERSESGSEHGIAINDDDSDDVKVDKDYVRRNLESMERNDGAYLTRSKSRSLNGNKSPSGTRSEHSLLANYFTSHYCKKKEKPKLSAKVLKNKEQVEEKVQSSLDAYVENEFSQESYDKILKFCERLPKVHFQILVKCIVRCVKYTPRDPYDYSNPNAAPLTEVQKLLLTLVVNLEKCYPTIVKDVLNRIHYIICDYNHHHYDATLFSLARFFLAFCKLRNDKQYLQIFLYDSLYCLKLRGYAIVNAIITGYADVFPKAEHLNDSLLVKVIVYIIFNYGRTTYLKTSSIRSYLSIYYGYKRDNLPNIDSMLKLLMEEIKNGVRPEVEQALLLLSKFQNDWNWTYNRLIKGGLFRIIESWKLGNATEEAAILSIKLIGYLAKTPPYERDDSALLLDDFEKLASSNTCTPRVKEACINGLASLIYIDETKVFAILRNFKIDGHLENSECVRTSLSFVCERRSYKWWKQYLTSVPKIVPLKVKKTYQKKKKN